MGRGLPHPDTKARQGRLAIVRRIVSAHGGRAYAANRKQGGACFTLWLPAHPGGQADER